MVVKKKVFYLSQEDNMVNLKHRNILLLLVVIREDKVGVLVSDKVWVDPRRYKVTFHYRVCRTILHLVTRVLQILSVRKEVMLAEVERKRPEQVRIRRR